MKRKKQETIVCRLPLTFFALRVGV